MHKERVAVERASLYKSKNMSKYTEDDLKVELENKEYEYGFYTELDSETFPIGLNEDIVRAISKKKEEPEWMTEWRLEAFRAWKEMVEFRIIQHPKKRIPTKNLKM
jgi:Fe-S cluster assembly protein SufB